ncbi:MAG: sulfite oxidase-like oxidoreductase [Dehalococcoidia bacterium]|nr:sulfite oxidase-like oxidoreductase [Dehalococcoidia bacterium]
MALDFLRRPNRAREIYGDRVPAGQRVTDGWPVLTYGAAPRVDLKEWTFQVAGAVEEELSFTWEDFNGLPQVAATSDVHCVTGWSKLDNEWQGVAFRELMKHIRPQPEAKHAMAHSYGGYTTNVPLDDLLGDGVLFAHSHNGEPLAPEHGGPMRLVVPHLYFWKSAKWVRGLFFMPDERPGFWEMYGYHIRGDPWKEERYS